MFPHAPSERVIFFRNFVFGVEDSLASTVGLLSGIAVAGLDRHAIVATGVVLIIVEAFSMAIGSYLSEQYTENYASRREMPAHRAVVGSFVMFASYIVAGFLPIFPYAFLSVREAFPISISLSLIALLFLGVFTSRVTRSHIFKTTLRMVVIGGLAVLVGAVIGKIFSL